MKVQAEVSLYPLRQNDLTEPVQQFVESLKNDNLNVKTGSMSSAISGEESVVFQSLQKAFEQAAQKYEVVLTTKISNACPKIE
ncbi:MAG: thiamine-binding protein [Deltaproteobacteria bacterium]|nr:thiamine-binding protein [Deltaproteobacteria bacterium]